MEKIRRFGHFTPNREIVRPSIAIPYGTSEMVMTALRKGVVDCAVTVCDGAGTVVTADADVVQGIGARMNGLFHTTPIAEVQSKLRARGCIIFDDAAIDQLRGIRAAVDAGYSTLGVTVNSCCGESLEAMRGLETALEIGMTIAAVCATGVSAERAEAIVRFADLTWSCGSRHMRDLGSKAILQITQGIPIFVYTRRGLEMIAAYADDDGEAVIGALDPRKQYLLYSGAGDRRIRLGNNLLNLREAALPVPGKRCPEPLV
jgi:putative methanogenesis marker protein 8